MKFKYKSAAALCTAFLFILSVHGESVSASIGSAYSDTGAITVNIDTSKGRKAISPYIYGLNAEALSSGVTVNAVIQTDPAVSSYNWETNVSNPGAVNGIPSENDFALVKSYPKSRYGEPALYTENLVAKAARYGVPSKYVTLQMTGFAADSAFADRPRSEVKFSKNDDGYLSNPDINDGVVYMDEYVSYLVNKYDYAVNGGINGYFLGREPENWRTLYPEAVAERVTADGLIGLSSELAYSVKKIDPTALVYGPSLNGIEAFINIKNQSDWEQHGIEYSWFIDYYLDGMKKASEKAGMRLLDVLDLHYHTEATNGLLEPIIGGDDIFSNNARLQATRILWDSTYTENSTSAILYNQHIPLLPTLAASIDMYYPGTRLSFSEYNFGGGGDISGGIAVADTLGVFAGYGVHMACAKPDTSDISYIKSALNIYTDYDGNGSGFGSTLVSSNNGGDIMSSVYASVDGADSSSLKIILINKNRSASKPAEINIRSDSVFAEAEVYSFDGDNSDIVKQSENIRVEDNSLSLDMAPLTVYMLAISAEKDAGSETTSPEGDVTETSEKPVTSAVHEHVDAETYSTVSLTDGAVTAETSDTLSADASDAGTFSAQTTVTSGGGSIEEEPKAVPKAVKIAVLALVAAVFIAMGYILISDHVLGKRKK